MGTSTAAGRIGSFLSAYIIHLVGSYLFIFTGIMHTSSSLVFRYFVSEKNKVLSFVWVYLERFPIKCRETKTKVITTANQNKGKYHRSQ